MKDLKSETLVTENELVTLLLSVETSTFINLVTCTDVRMNKTGNPFFGRVKKISSRNYLIGNDYENRVRKNEDNEGFTPDFEAEKASGKTHVSKCVLKSDKDENVKYLMVELFDEIPPVVEYIYDGNPIEKSLFEAYMTKVYESQKQEQERKVIVITPKISSIRALTMNGIRYMVVR